MLCFEIYCTSLIINLEKCSSSNHFKQKVPTKLGITIPVHEVILTVHLQFGGRFINTHYSFSLGACFQDEQVSAIGNKKLNVFGRTSQSLICTTVISLMLALTIWCLFLQGLPGPPGLPGPSGKRGPRVSKIGIFFSSVTSWTLIISQALNHHFIVACIHLLVN